MRCDVSAIGGSWREQRKEENVEKQEQESQMRSLELQGHFQERSLESARYRWWLLETSWLGKALCGIR